MVLFAAVWVAVVVKSFAASNCPLNNDPFEKLDHHLIKSFSPNPQERALAEYNLSELSMNDKILPTLLHKCTQDTDKNVRIAAAIFMKNTLQKRYKKKPSDPLLTLNEYQFFIQHLIPSMVISSSLMMKNLKESLNLLIIQKDHHVWLAPFFSQTFFLLQSQNEAIFLKGLILLKFLITVTKKRNIKLRFMDNNMNFLPFISQYLPPLALSIQNGNSDSIVIATEIIKILSLFPADIECVFPQAANLLLMPIPLNPSEEFWKLKIVCYKLLNTLFNIYQTKCGDFLHGLYQTFQLSLASLTFSPSHLPDQLITLFIMNLRSILNCIALHTHLENKMSVIYHQFVFPKGIMMKVSDLDLFDEDAEEYLIRRHYFVNQDHLPLNRAINLVKQLADTNFYTTIIEACVQIFESTYRLEDPPSIDWVDGACIVFGSLSSKLSELNFEASSIQAIYTQLIGQDSNLLIARAIWLIGKCRRLFTTEEVLSQILSSLISFINHENFAIRDSAANSFRLYLKVPLSKEILKQNGVEVFEKLYIALQKYGEYRLSDTFITFVTENVQALLPHSSTIIPKVIFAIDSNLNIIDSRKRDESRTIEFRMTTSLFYILETLVVNNSPTENTDNLFGVIEKFMSCFPGDFEPIISIIKVILPNLSVSQLEILMKQAQSLFVIGMLEQCHSLLNTVLLYRNNFLASAQPHHLELIRLFLDICFKSENPELKFFIGHSLYKVIIENHGSIIFEKAPNFIDVILPVNENNILIHVRTMTLFPFFARNILLQRNQWENFLKSLSDEAGRGNCQLLSSICSFASLLPADTLKILVPSLLSHSAVIFAKSKQGGKKRLADPNNDENSKELKKIFDNVELLINSNLEIKLGLSSVDKKNYELIKKHIQSLQNI